MGSERDEKVKTLMVQPSKEPKIMWIDLSLSAFDTAVSQGCGFQCHTKAKKIKKGIYMLYAEEGVTLMAAANRRIGKEIIFGVFYIIAVKDGIINSLSDEQTKKYIARFKVPDEFTEEEVLFYCLDNVCKELDDLHFEEI